MKLEMLPNIKEHSQQVMNVAIIITDNLKKNIQMNKQLIIAASLLHDITKTKSLQTKEPHDITGGKYLRDLGFPEVAEIVEEHIFLRHFQSAGPIEEKEIVYYADKRVMHNDIVTVEERIKDLLSRYGKTQEIRDAIIKNEELIHCVEKKINNGMLKNIDTLFITPENR